MLRTIAFVATLLLVAVLWSEPAVTQEAEPETGPAPIAVQDDDFQGRLPPYYSRVVDGIQREQIYGIQAKYAKQLADLEAQMKALEAKRDTEIEGVLRPDQVNRLKQLRGDSASR
jgi:hypothetical protein